MPPSLRLLKKDATVPLTTIIRKSSRLNGHKESTFEATDRNLDGEKLELLNP